MKKKWRREETKGREQQGCGPQLQFPDLPVTGGARHGLGLNPHNAAQPPLQTLKRLYFLRYRLIWLISTRRALSGPDPVLLSYANMI